ncbi:MAG: homocysteine S-methyltransferase [Litorilinea sp.]
MSNVLQTVLETQGYVVLDGALATELEARGADLQDPLWSARVLLDAPDLVRQVHADYFRAGADIAITASYQATFAGLAARGLDRAAAARLLQQSVRLAQAARAEFWADPTAREGRAFPLIAASIGPYAAYLADGSEYRGDYSLSQAELVAFHGDRLAALVAAQPDLLACETIPCQIEALALLEVLADQATHTPNMPPAWLSFACRNDHQLNSGESFAEAVATVQGAPHIAAIGINCTAPQYIAGLLQIARAHTDKPLLVYPNRGERWDARARCWIADPDAPALADYLAAWRAAGAVGIGGCCRTGPADIQRIAARLRPSTPA